MAADAAHREVDFGESGALFFKNYANFKGRSSRGAYWWWFLISVLLSVALTLIDTTIFGTRPEEFGVLGGLFTLATVIPNIALGVRRLHDTDKSGWWLLLALVPIAGGIILIVMFCQPGARAENSYGPDVEAGRPQGPSGYARTFT